MKRRNQSDEAAASSSGVSPQLVWIFLGLCVTVAFLGVLSKPTVTITLQTPQPRPVHAIHTLDLGRKAPDEHNNKKNNNANAEPAVPHNEEEQQPHSKETCLRKATKVPSVSIAGNRPVGTYLCDYFPKAPKISGGCKLSCPLRDAAGSDRSVQCAILDKAKASDLFTHDVIVNHHGPVPRKKQSGPLFTMYYTGESNFSEPKKSTAQYQGQYDIVVSFHSFRKHYFTWTNRFHKQFTEIVAGEKKWPAWSSQRPAIAIFVSRCKKGGRDEVIKEMGKHFEVRSFGKCARTHTVESEHSDCASLGGGRYPQKLCVFSRYRFVLALDNSRETDYVTEKVYHALLSGAIPLYDGAPNINDFIPSLDAVVHLKEFKDPHGVLDYGQLANYLKSIDEDSKHVQWRKVRDMSEFSPQFVEHLNHQEPTCDICREVAEHKCTIGRK